MSLLERNLKHRIGFNKKMPIHGLNKSTFKLRELIQWLFAVPVVMFIMAYCGGGSASSAAAESQTDNFKSLRQKLVSDGFDRNRIDRLYSRPGVVFDTDSVSLFFIHSEAKLNYDQFTSKDSIHKARRYLAEQAEILAVAQKTYGVDKEIITGIILVETRLGTIVGNSKVFSTLSTMAALTEPQVRERLWDNIPSSRRISRQKFKDKADKKSKWAYKELKALIEYAAQEGIDPTAVRGSYAGAIGICQFMPSNISRLARDGNQDGRVDLFNHADAIYSVANYLKHHGWRPGISPKKAYKVILRYNYSRYYANTILKVAELLKG